MPLLGQERLIQRYFGERSDAQGEGRVACANPSCSSGWTRLLKDRRRPIFERRWGCSARCVKAIVEAAVRRERGDAAVTEDTEDHSHRVPMGLVLLAQGWITHPQLQHALEVQRRAGKGKIGRLLVEECGLEEERVTRALGVQWRCPVFATTGFDPERMALAAPRLLLEHVGMVPLRIVGGRALHLGFADKLNAAAAFAMERMSGLKAESGVVDEGEFKAAQRRLLDSDFVDTQQEEVEDIDAMSTKIAALLAKLQPISSRLVRVNRFFWLRMWLESGAMGAADGGIPASREDMADCLFTLANKRGVRDRDLPMPMRFTEIR